MSDGLERDMGFSRRFLAEMKRILGEHLIAEASAYEDQKHCTDLIVLRLDGVRVACRVRRFKYLRSYGADFTIRSRRYSGAETEYEKIIAGWGDYLLYGFADDGERQLVRWFLGDLKVFRAWQHRSLENALAARSPSPWFHAGFPHVEGGVSLKANADRSSDFLAFPLAWMPPQFLKAHYGFPSNPCTPPASRAAGVSDPCRQAAATVRNPAYYADVAAEDGLP